MSAPLIELRNVSKSFSSVLALRDVTFAVNRPEIVSLVGDNGAGKSTLIKIISGVHSPDLGDIYVNGEKMTHWSVTRAREAGIETVYQDKALAEQQTVMRNIFMGRELRGRLGTLRLNDERAETEALMRRIGFTSKIVRPESVVANLSGGEREGVAIARAMYFNADLIILDEPTSALSLTQAQEVLRFVQRVKGEGRSVVFITHNIYHAHEVADRLVLLDRGDVVASIDKATISIADP